MNARPAAGPPARWPAVATAGEAARGPASAPAAAGAAALRDDRRCPHATAADWSCRRSGTGPWPGRGSRDPSRRASPHRACGDRSGTTDGRSRRSSHVPRVRRHGRSPMFRPREHCRRRAFCQHHLIGHAAILRRSLSRTRRTASPDPAVGRNHRAGHADDRHGSPGEGSGRRRPRACAGGRGGEGSSSGGAEGFTRRPRDRGGGDDSSKHPIRGQAIRRCRHEAAGRETLAAGCAGIRTHSLLFDMSAS